MRIIAGAYKGRRLQGPPDDRVRPTSDRLRETLFNVLMNELADARVLDGFAGTGALGLEALSRGARHVTFVEKDRRVLSGLRGNVATCDAGNACTIEHDDFLGFVSRHPDVTAFDLVLLDPPYDFRDLDAVLVEAARLVMPSGLVVLEHSSRRAVPEHAAGLTRRRSIKAGDSTLALYRSAPGAVQP